jgi:hypothetical protein
MPVILVLDASNALVHSGRRVTKTGVVAAK